MKYRSGFVSNSSSSSFVVAFDKVPESAEELQQMLFGGKTHFHQYTATEVAKTVFRDMQGLAEGGSEEWPISEYKQPLNEKAVFSCFRRGYVDGDPDLDFAHAEWEEIFKVREKHMSKYRANLALRFLHDNKDKFLFQFRYSDNDGDYYSTLEHGDLFTRLPHVRFSEH